MGWEKRRQRNYYYRSRKIRGKVIKEYCGCGDIAEAAALMDEDLRVRKAATRQAYEKEQERLSQADKGVHDFIRHLDRLMKAQLLLAGYRQHKRGEWRKKRDKTAQGR